MAKRSLGKSAIAAVITRYRAIRARLGQCLRRGDPDYSEVTGLAQQSGRLRQQIRDYFRRKRERRAQTLAETRSGARRRASA
jgi:hypothetical protein